MMQMLQFILIFTCLSLVPIAVGLPLITKKVKPNPFYGIRTPKTMSNADIWYDTNAYAGWGFLITGLVMLVMALLLPLFISSVNIYSMLVTLTMVIGVSITLVLSYRRMREF